MIKKLVLLTIVFGVVFFYTWQQIQVFQIGYAITAKEKKLKDLQQENMELLIKTSRLKSPRRIELFSKEKLGLVAPEKAPIVYLKTSPELMEQREKNEPPHGTDSESDEGEKGKILSWFIKNILLGGTKVVQAEALNL